MENYEADGFDGGWGLGGEEVLERGWGLEGIDGDWGVTVFGAWIGVCWSW